MATLKSFPHYTIDLVDNTIFEPVVFENLPLHRPIYFMKTEKGELNVPVYYKKYTDAVKQLGARTFDKRDKTYFSSSSKYLMESFKNIGAFIVRLADPAATASIRILELAVEELVIVQYQKDPVTGVRLVWTAADVTAGSMPASNNPTTGKAYAVGDPKPEFANNALPVAGGEVLAAGVRLEWKVRDTFAVGETATNILPTIIGPVTTYPIMVFESSSPGVWGDNTGFSLYYNATNNTRSLVTRQDSLVFDFAPVVKEPNGTLVDPIRDRFNSVSSSFSFKPGAVDSATDQEISAKAVLQFNYNNTAPIPYVITVYNENINTIGTLINTKEIAINPSVSDILTNGFRSNIVNGRDIDNLPYDGMVFSNSSLPMVNGTNTYLINGTDGSTAEDQTDPNYTPGDVTIEELRRQYLATTTYPDIIDKARYPFTHLFDAGYELDTKYAMLTFLDTRDDIKVVLGTHINSVGGNTAAQDLSLGITLHSRAILMRESVLKGTAACRATIFAQSGVLLDDVDEYTGMTIWSATKKAEYQNKTYLDREAKGLPNADVGIFKSYNYVPSADTLKSDLWDIGLNYCQYYDMTSQHYPSVRTVYKYDSSVLVDDEFVDFAAVYAKQIVRRSWATHVGLTKTFDVLKKLIEDDLFDKLNAVANGKYTIDLLVYQTELERNLGYIDHVQVTITSPGTVRVWTTDIICNREGV